MKIISHRGNLSGPNPNQENKPSQIISAIQRGFEVEIDVWFKDKKFYLGHDEPQYDFPFELLEKFYNKLWIHAKSFETLVTLKDIDYDGLYLNYFWHQSDDYVLTSKGYIWTFPNKLLSYNSICVKPEVYKEKPILDCAGICTDFPIKYETNI